MQETTARKRAPLLQQLPPWKVATAAKTREHRKSRSYRHQRYQAPIDIDITHPHVPIMHDEQQTPDNRRDSSPEARSGASDDERSITSSDLDHEDPYADDDQEAGLTSAERSKRRKQWHERLADGQIEDRSPVTWLSMLRANIINVVLIGMWYTFSIAISVYNKWMFSEKNLHFPFPLFTTSAHMLVQFTLSGAVLYFLPSFRPHAEVQEHGGIEDRHGKKTQVMSLKYYLTRIGPCGTATALDIGLGNFSLRFISLAFYTMCKSSVLAFVLLFAFLFRLERPSWKLGGIIGIMTIGVIMMVAGENAFSPIGFILVMSASFCSGFRWSLTQILLLRNSATSNPFSSIFFLTPVMFVSLVILAIPIEGPVNLVIGFRNLAHVKGPLMGVLIMMFPGMLAFMMVSAEFALLQRTSVVTLSVCGIFKEVLTISTAARTFGDELSPINISGLIVTIGAIAGYNYLKYLKMKEELERKAMKKHDLPRGNPYDAAAAEPMLSQETANSHANGHSHDSKKLKDVG